MTTGHLWYDGANMSRLEPRPPQHRYDGGPAPWQWIAALQLVLEHDHEICNDPGCEICEEEGDDEDDYGWDDEDD